MRKEVINFVAELNKEKGHRYNLVYGVLHNYLEKAGYKAAEIGVELALLKDEGIIDANLGDDKFFDTSIRITAVGYQQLDPWYKKFWRWFSDDFYKILTVVATILSIFATTVSLWKK